MNMVDDPLFDIITENIERYTSNLEIDQKDLNISLKPFYDVEGEIKKIEYSLSINNKENIIENSINFNTSLSKQETTYKDFIEWKNNLKASYSDNSILSNTEDFLDLAEAAIENVYRFGKMARIDNDQIIVLLDLVKDDHTWAIDYNVRTNSDIQRRFKLDDRTYLNSYEPQRIISEAYPLWVQKMDEEFGEIKHTDFEKLSNHFDKGYL